MVPTDIRSEGLKRWRRRRSGSDAWGCYEQKSVARRIVVGPFQSNCRSLKRSCRPTFVLSGLMTGFEQPAGRPTFVQSSRLSRAGPQSVGVIFPVLNRCRSPRSHRPDRHSFRQSAGSVARRVMAPGREEGDQSLGCATGRRSKGHELPSFKRQRGRAISLRPPERPTRGRACPGGSSGSRHEDV